MIRSNVLATALSVLTFSAACAKDKDTGEAAAPMPAPKQTSPTPAAPTDPGMAAPTGSDPAGMAGGDHGHRPMHGGKVATTAEGHLELVATAGGEFHVYMHDKSGAMRPADGATGTVKIGASGPELKLAPMEDHLAGKGAPIKEKHADAQVTVNVGGKNETASFKLDFEDHGGDKKHGGGHDMKDMKGDMGEMKPE